jgi:hypothetical protein
MKQQVLVAARLETASPLLFGRALCPNGFSLLQDPPCSLPAYAAARVRHALTRDPGVSDAEIVTVAAAYVKHPECSFPAQLDRLANMCSRAGAASPKGAALALVWSRSFDAVTELVLPRSPHAFLREAMRAESKRCQYSF